MSNPNLDHDACPPKILDGAPFMYWNTTVSGQLNVKGKVKRTHYAQSDIIGLYDLKFTLYPTIHHYRIRVDMLLPEDRKWVYIPQIFRTLREAKLHSFIIQQRHLAYAASAKHYALQKTLNKFNLLANK